MQGYWRWGSSWTLLGGFGSFLCLETNKKAQEAEKLANERNVSFLNEKINNKILEISSLEKKNEVFQKSNDLDLIRFNEIQIKHIQKGIDSLNLEINKINQ